MKIVMLTEIYDERMQYQDNLFAKYYVKHGHDVTVIATTVDNTLEFLAGRERYDARKPRREYFDHGAKVVKLPLTYNLLQRLRRLSGVDEVLKAERPDLIFVHDVHMNLGDAIRYRRRHPQCRVILDCHADMENSARNWVSRLILHTLTRKVVLDRYRAEIDQIYAVWPAVAEFLHQLYGVPREDMRLLRLGADIDLANEVRASSARRDIRAQLGIPDDARAVFSGGKISRAKKTHVLMGAVARLAADDVHLILVGDLSAAGAEYQSQLTQAAAENPRVHLTGWVDSHDVYRYMSASDLAVFPASQSVLWQQANAVGVPVIVGAIGNQDLSYLNFHDNMLLLHESDINVDTLAETIGRLFRNPEELERRRAGALKAAEEAFNYHRLVEETLAVPRRSETRR
jgi:1,2-diacylglycerol 3-alpha-glucosyltransferase